MKTGIELIATERRRQIRVEGYNQDHDNVINNNGELAIAAAAYALPDDFAKLPPEIAMIKPVNFSRIFWPWQIRYFKRTPNNRVKELVKAGALIAAEIDRIQNLT